MIVNSAADLDQVSNCPMAEECANCGSELELSLETVETMQGVFCLTLCDECLEFGRMPKFYAPQVAGLVLDHCAHLGITCDRMEELIRAAEADR